MDYKCSFNSGTTTHVGTNTEWITRPVHYYVINTIHQGTYTTNNKSQMVAFLIPAWSCVSLVLAMASLKNYVGK